MPEDGGVGERRSRGTLGDDGAKSQGGGGARERRGMVENRQSMKKFSGAEWRRKWRGVWVYAEGNGGGVLVDDEGMQNFFFFFFCKMVVA